MRNGNGVVVEILNYGAIVRALRVPDKQGSFDDVTTGFDSMAGISLRFIINCLQT